MLTTKINVFNMLRAFFIIGPLAIAYSMVSVKYDADSDHEITKKVVSTYGKEIKYADKVNLIFTNCTKHKLGATCDLKGVFALDANKDAKPSRALTTDKEANNHE